MWTAKFKIEHEDWITTRTEKYNISALGIPINKFEKKGITYHTGLVYITGDKKNKDKFIASLKNDKKISKFTVKGNQIFVLIKGEQYTSIAFDPSLFLLKPVMIEKGIEYWEIASWSRKELIKFYDETKKFSKVKILKLKSEFPGVFIQKTVPKLTEKQKEAFMFAKSFGYYKYPRDISVEELAKRKKVPRTTFQNHLRKAESKILDVILE